MNTDKAKTDTNFTNYHEPAGKGWPHQQNRFIGLQFV
jgi:hypothetical protein